MCDFEHNVHIQDDSFIEDINNLFINLENKANQLFNKLKHNKTQLRVEEKDGKIIKICVEKIKWDDPDYKYAGNCYNNVDYFDDNIVSIIKRCQFIEKEIIGYKKILQNLVNNKKEIINHIGIKMYNDDTEWFKEEIQKTDANLNRFIHNYVWEFE